MLPPRPCPPPARPPRLCRERRGGRDHIWLVTHDEASCWVPAAIRSTSIILSHWGRMDAHHTSGTGYSADVYSNDVTHPQFEPDGFLGKLNLTQPCYDPVKVSVCGLCVCGRGGGGGGMCV